MRAERASTGEMLAGYSAYPGVSTSPPSQVAKEVGACSWWTWRISPDFRGRVYPSPVPHADVVTTTTHKIARSGGGMILYKESTPP